MIQGCNSTESENHGYLLENSHNCSIKGCFSKYSDYGAKIVRTGAVTAAMIRIALQWDLTERKPLRHLPPS